MTIRRAVIGGVNKSQPCCSAEHQRCADLQKAQKFQKFQMAAEILHREGMKMEDKTGIAKAVLFLALYDPNSPEEVDVVVEKVQDISSKLQAEVQKGPQLLRD